MSDVELHFNRVMQNDDLAAENFYNFMHTIVAEPLFSLVEDQLGKKAVSRYSGRGGNFRISKIETQSGIIKGR